MIRMRRAWGFAALCLSAGLLFAIGPIGAGCKRVAEREAEKRVRDLLPQYLGPADKYETRVDSDNAGAVTRGRLRRVSVVGTNVRFDPTLTIDRLSLELSDVDVDTKARRLRDVGTTRFECRIAGDRLDRYVRARRSDIPDLRVALTGDVLRVTARPSLRVGDALDRALERTLGINGGGFTSNLNGRLGASVTVEGRLAARGDSRLDFRPDLGKLSVIPIPSAILDWLSARLNPAVDLTGLPVPVQITNAEVRGGFLVLSGTVAPADILRVGNNAAP